MAAVFGRTAAEPGPRRETAPPAIPGRLADARKSFDKAEKALGQGNWVEFGRAMDEVRKLLQSEELIQ